MAEININFSDNIGKIKPMHGVGQPPVIGRADYSMMKYLREAGIPFSRLHDVGGPYGGNVFVDIPNIFRDFDADPENPDAYDFSFTDLLIASLVENGVEPFYRLGVTIENDCVIKAYRIYPPEDNLKWAKICAGIIKHYTQGWANGFNYNIRYWEIWNEPENHPDPKQNPMWQGTKEQFFELYNVASKYLKNQFPHLKIGGYGSCGFYSIDECGAISAANSTDRTDYFIEYFDDFLSFARENECPLDFFSWHSYADVDRNIIFANYARKKLDAAGFTACETTCNEWNPQVHLRGTAKHAAMVTAGMLAFQNTPLDSAMFYDARMGISIYGSLFDPIKKVPYPAYYGFVAYNELYCRGAQVSAEIKGEGIYAVATRGDTGCLVAANISEHDQKLCIISDRKIKSCKLIDEKHMLENTEVYDEIPAGSVMLFEFE